MKSTQEVDYHVFSVGEYKIRKGKQEWHQKLMERRMSQLHEHNMNCDLVPSKSVSSQDVKVPDEQLTPFDGESDLLQA